MPTNRLVFFLFLIVLVAALFYLRKAPNPPGQTPVTLTPKQYIERVEAAKPTQPVPAESQSGN